MKQAETTEVLLRDLKAETSRRVPLDQLAAQFAKDGVLAFPNFFSPGEMEEVNGELDVHFEELKRTLLKEQMNELAHDHGCDVVPWNPCGEGNEVFQRFHALEKLHRVTEAVLGAGYTAPSSLVMFCIPGGRGQAWHQDCPEDDATVFNLNRLIYTRDVKPEEGSIVFVPGSHRWGRIPPGGHQDPMEGEITLAPTAGTLLFVHGHVFHRVTPNESTRPRISVNFRAFPLGVDPDVTCIGVYRTGTVNFCDEAKQHDGAPAKM